MSGYFVGCLELASFQDRWLICLDSDHGSYCSLQLQSPQALHLELKPRKPSTEALPSTITNSLPVCEVALSPMHFLRGMKFSWGELWEAQH